MKQLFENNVPFQWCPLYHRRILKCAVPLLLTNRTAHIRHLSMKTTVLSCHRYLNNTGVEKNEQHLNID
jgi:hypothetical protein